jgi:catechol 2,3-dioxygenase-like lactoylglutathione lyase family enzyme
MAEHATSATCGIDHVGLSVRDLESTRCFFCDCLGWRVVGERPDYPAAPVACQARERRTRQADFRCRSAHETFGLVQCSRQT